jgi:hypothetical protein
VKRISYVSKNAKQPMMLFRGAAGKGKNISVR